MSRSAGAVAFVAPGDRLPDPRGARGDGLVAVGGDLSVERLLEAYRGGLFPWSADPVTWWSPDPRGILEVAACMSPTASPGRCGAAPTG